MKLYWPKTRKAWLAEVRLWGRIAGYSLVAGVTVSTVLNILGIW